MALIGLIALAFPFPMGYAVFVSLARQFGPGPLVSPRILAWRAWLRHPRAAPFSRWQRRLARKVLYPVGEVEGLTWAQQRTIYWRVRRFPDGRYRGSQWGAAMLGVVVAIVCGLVVWGCGSAATSGLTTAARNLSRPVRESWVAWAVLVPYLLYLFAPMVVGALASIGLARDDARDAIRRYVSSRITACDRCKYPLSDSMASGRHARVVRCPECGLGHDLRWRSPARPAGRLRVRAPADGPTLTAPRRAARICRGVPSLHAISSEQAARLLDHALWVERAGVVLARLFATLVAVVVATGVVVLLWPAIEAALGTYRHGRPTGSNALSMAIASLGPGVGVAVWLWMERLMLRGMARRAGARRGLTCPACGYSLQGLAVGQSGLIACPECGGAAFPAEGVPTVLPAEELGAPSPRSQTP